MLGIDDEDRGSEVVDGRALADPSGRGRLLEHVQMKETVEVEDEVNRQRRRREIEARRGHPLEQPRGVRRERHEKRQRDDDRLPAEDRPVADVRLEKEEYRDRRERVEQGHRHEQPRLVSVRDRGRTEDRGEPVVAPRDVVERVGRHESDRPELYHTEEKHPLRPDEFGSPGVFESVREEEHRDEVLSEPYRNLEQLSENGVEDQQRESVRPGPYRLADDSGHEQSPAGLVSVRPEVPEEV